MLSGQDLLVRLRGYVSLLYLLLGAALVAGSFYYHWSARLQPLLGEWEAASAQTERMRMELQRLRQLEERMPVLIQTAEDGRAQLRRVQNFLPHQADFPGLVSQISLAASKHGVRLTGVTATDMEGDAEIKPVALRITAVATYGDLLRFLATLERLERIVTIREITVVPAPFTGSAGSADSVTSPAAGGGETSTAQVGPPAADLVQVEMLLASYSLASPPPLSVLSAESGLSAQEGAREGESVDAADEAGEAEPDSEGAPPAPDTGGEGR